MNRRRTMFTRGRHKFPCPGREKTAVHFWAGNNPLLASPSCTTSDNISFVSVYSICSPPPPPSSLIPPPSPCMLCLCVCPLPPPPSLGPSRSLSWPMHKPRSPTYLLLVGGGRREEDKGEKANHFSFSSSSRAANTAGAAGGRIGGGGKGGKRYVV